MLWRRHTLARITAGLCLALATGSFIAAPNRAGAAGNDLVRGEWPVYGADHGATKYSPLAQIDAENVGDLYVAWLWSSPDNARLARMAEENPGSFLDHFKGTPLMVKGTLFIRTSLGIVAAIDPASGENRWVFDAERYLLGRPASYGFTTRGVAYWEDEAGAGRILFTTSDRKLVALDAASGEPIPSFGENGFVDLDRSLRRPSTDTWQMNYGNQVPVVVGGVVVLGSSMGEWARNFRREDPDPPVTPVGDVRGFDVRSGKHLWTFHTVPQDGEHAVETWAADSWKWVGHTNVWSLLSADEELGAVYLPVSAPTSNYYGGIRPGDNLFAQSIVCLDARTGKRRWHFQTVHHALFDYDLPAAPVLADVEIGGTLVKALVQVTKQGFTFVLDRRTGTPVWPIEERPVPQSTVPGERTSRTQPFPTRPPPFAQQGLSQANLLDLTPDLHEMARKRVKDFDYGQLFTPVSLRGTVLVPGIGGGANWSGGAFDPDTGLFYVTAVNMPFIRSLVKSEGFFAYRTGRPSATIEGLPLVKPPWATITAIDLNVGDLRWQVANGEGPRSHPRLRGLELPYLGVVAKSHPLVTKTLLFAATSGQGVYRQSPDLGRVRVSRQVTKAQLQGVDLGSLAVVRAYDKASGAILWEHPIGPSYNDGGALMTYSHRGRQYVVLPTGGGRDSAHLIAFALPSTEDPGRGAADILKSTPGTDEPGTTGGQDRLILGRRLFNEGCGGCHGPHGDVRMRTLAHLDDDQVLDILRNPPAGMPLSEYSREEEEALLAYLRSSLP